MLVFSLGVFIWYQNYLNITHFLSDKRDIELYTSVNETQVNNKPLQELVLREVGKVLWSNRDKKVDFSFLAPWYEGNDISSAAWKRYAKDAWDWIGWGWDYTTSWTILVSKDGFDCKQLKQIPKEIEENFKSIIYQNGKKYCYDRSN
jgi:hypothetical protein